MPMLKPVTSQSCQYIFTINNRFYFASTTKSTHQQLFNKPPCLVAQVATIEALPAIQAKDEAARFNFFSAIESYLVVLKTMNRSIHPSRVAPRESRQVFGTAGASGRHSAVVVIFDTRRDGR